MTPHPWAGHVNGDQLHCAKCGRGRGDAIHTAQPASRALTDDDIERLAVAQGVKFRRIYRPGNKSWTDMTESTVKRDALIRIVRAALAARWFPSPACTDRL